MGRIRILSDHIANKIAAGEVVERPASVVKELLENSLDAGATDIRILVEAGGRRLIRIADDGHGMLRDDALLAFERHATSKLSDANDLLAIATLGFRGEALPSIASVSRLLLETRSAEEESGTRVEIAGGRILSCDDLARTPGTTITIRDLFYNVPARKKFLRSEQTELAHIASLVTHYSLAHPAKGFALQHGEHELLQVAPVETLEERVYQVFGNQILNDLVDIGTHERDVSIPAPYVPEEEAGEPSTRTFRLRGFISGPQIQKLNRNSIYLFVNGRLIRDRVLMHALTAGYHNLIPPASYPFALLFLDCDPEEVDVNVHPAKTEVRFRHSGTVHDFVRDAIRGKLTERRPVAGISAVPVVSGEQLAAQLPYSEFSQRMDNAAYSNAPPSELPVMQTGLPEFTLHRPVASPAPRFAFEEASPATPRLPVPDTHGRVLPESALFESPTLEALKDLRPLGQLHDSFIIAAGRDGLWLVDQHVAHERILFEQVMRQRGRAPETQALLMPIVLQLTAAQQIEYARIADEVNAMGFETAPFGNRTIAVKAAPAGVSAGDIEKVVFEVLEIAEKEFRKASLEDMRRGIAASIACRAAIKINMRLDQKKMEWLLQELAKTEHPMSCPHGRPIALRYTMREILRSFHRI